MMMRVLLLAATVAAADDVGVCWYRTAVRAAKAESDLALVYASMATLGRGNLSTCLITDATEEVARRALKKLGKQHGSPATLDAYVAAPRRVDMSMLPAQWRHRASIKLGRLVTWATKEPPFAVTLYVDDDTYFCGPAPRVASELLALGRASPSVDVRMTNYFADRGFGADRKRASGQMRKAVRDCLRERCVASCATNSDACLACRTTCHDRPTGESGGSCPAVSFSPLERFRAQTGSILVRRGGSAATFFQDWAERYVEMWRGKRRRLRNNSVGTDQAPCDSLLARACGAKRARPWTLGWLPANWNLRPTYSHAEPLWGPVRLLHDDGIGHHKSPRDRIALGRAACDRVNAAGNGTGWRLIIASGSRHGAAVLRETNALDEVVRPFATSVEAAAAALVARVKRSN